jgi:hypothetical protein
MCACILYHVSSTYEEDACILYHMRRRMHAYCIMYQAHITYVSMMAHMCNTDARGRGYMHGI